MESDYTNTTDVLDQLKKVYPNELPKGLTIGESALARLMGQQDVIRSIEQALFIQEQRNQG